MELHDYTGTCINYKFYQNVAFGAVGVYNQGGTGYANCVNIITGNSCYSTGTIISNFQVIGWGARDQSALTIHETPAASNRTQLESAYLTNQQIDTIWKGWNVEIYVKRSEEEQRELERLETIRRAAAAARAERMAVADKRGEDLLHLFLSDDQRRLYQEKRYFEVLSGDGLRRYRLHRNWAGNVQLFEGDRHVETLCIHGTEAVPLGDHLLTQKLMIESDEQEFRRIANITPQQHRRAAAA